MITFGPCLNLNPQGANHDVYTNRGPLRVSVRRALVKPVLPSLHKLSLVHKCTYVSDQLYILVVVQKVGDLSRDIGK